MFPKKIDNLIAWCTIVVVIFGFIVIFFYNSHKLADEYQSLLSLLPTNKAPDFPVPDGVAEVQIVVASEGVVIGGGIGGSGDVYYIPSGTEHFEGLILPGGKKTVEERLVDIEKRLKSIEEAIQRANKASATDEPITNTLEINPDIWKKHMYLDQPGTFDSKPMWYKK